MHEWSGPRARTQRRPGPRCPTVRVARSRHKGDSSMSVTTIPRQTRAERASVTPAARTVDAVKTYGKGAAEVHALDGVTVQFGTSQFTAIMGPSGSGKSTLLHCIAGLDSLTSGSAFIGEKDLSTLNDHDLTILRRDRIGFVFQAYNL